MNPAWREFPILAGVNDSCLEFLAGRALSLHKKEGELLVKEGEVGNRLFLVRSGSVSVRKHFGTIDEMELALLKKGDFFGEMCILETLPRTATVVAMTDADFFSLSSLDFYHLFHAMPDQYSLLILNIARDLSRRLRHLDELFAARH